MGQDLSHDDIGCPMLLEIFFKVHKKWASIFKILVCKDADTIFYGRFYTALIQSVLLFGL